MNPFAPTALLVLDPEIGSIVMWQGAIVDIPENWILCDGTNGSPDLRDKMIVGSTGTYDQKQIGGTEMHDHSFTDDSHDHDLVAGALIRPKSGFKKVTETEPASGLSAAVANLPNYYSLAFIMFVGD